MSGAERAICERTIDPVSAANGARPPIFAFGMNAWSTVWADRQFILATLAKRGWPVVYTSGALRIWERESVLWTKSSLTSRFTMNDGVLTCQAGRIPPRWQRFKSWDKTVMAYHRRQLMARLKNCDFDQMIMFVTHPVFSDYLDVFKPRCLVYSVHDGYHLMPGWTDRLADCTQRLMDAADIVVCSNRWMLQKQSLERYENKIYELPHGVDLTSFSFGQEHGEPEDLASIPHPRIAYFGTLNYKVDFSLIAHVAEQRSDWHWVLIGPQGQSNDENFSNEPAIMSQWKKCKSLPNVHFLGAKPRTEVGNYARFMDVLTMCYRQDGGGWWNCIQPLKLFEYMAVGKPIVSNDLIAARPYANLIWVARNPAEWIDALELSIASHDPSLAATLQAVARKNTWDERIDRLEGWLDAMLATKQASMLGDQATVSRLPGRLAST